MKIEKSKITEHIHAHKIYFIRISVIILEYNTTKSSNLIKHWKWLTTQLKLTNVQDKYSLQGTKNTWNRKQRKLNTTKETATTVYTVL